MYIFRIKNTKTNTIEEINIGRLAVIFECDTFYDNNISRIEYENYLIDAGEEKEDYINYWKVRNIYNDELDYFTAMVEYNTWTSPTGIIPEYKVIEIREED